MNYSFKQVVLGDTRNRNSVSISIVMLSSEEKHFRAIKKWKGSGTMVRQYEKGIWGASWKAFRISSVPGLDRGICSCATQCSSEFEPHFVFMSQHLEKTVYMHFH